MSTVVFSCIATLCLTLCVSLFVCPQLKFRHYGVAIAIYSDSDHETYPNRNPYPNPDSIPHC